MITEHDLQEAIAECQGDRNPNANTCIKLAAYYTIMENLYPKEQKPEQMVASYSYDPPETYTSETEFGKLCAEKDFYDVMKVVDELMSTVQMLQPRLYNAVIRKITAI